MCHNICAGLAFGVYPYSFNQILVGTKAVSVKKGEIRPAFFNYDKMLKTESSVFQSPHGLRVYGIEDNPVICEQEIVFNIPTERRAVCITRTVRAGFHISPPIEPASLSIYHTAFQVPVLFDLSHIVFYDGKEVSVSEFIIPYKLTMGLNLSRFWEIYNG